MIIGFNIEKIQVEVRGPVNFHLLSDVEELLRVAQLELMQQPGHAPIPMTASAHPTPSPLPN